MSFGTEFISVLHPPVSIADWDKTKRANQQPSTVPSLFRDALSIRQEVYCDEQGVALENEVDEDDKRSWHWVVNASVASTSSPPPENLIDTTPQSTNGSIRGTSARKTDEERRPSASAISLPVGTIRLIPPPHGPNPYKAEEVANSDSPAPAQSHHPKEPYIKLGRLATLREYRRLGLSRLLINTALEFASKNPQLICPAPSPTTIELAKTISKEVEEAVTWKGLCMVHAQVSVIGLWTRHGFSEELIDDHGNIEIEKEEHWFEEGIEHLAMWKRIKMQPPSQ